MRLISWGVILSLIVVARVAGWWIEDGRIWVDDHVLEFELTVPESVYQTYSETVLRHQNRTVRCSLKVEGCYELLDRVYERVRVRGRVRVLEDGKQELEVHRVRLSDSRSAWVLIRREIRTFRERLVSLYKSSLSEPYAGLLSGIVLGKQERMDEEFYEMLSRTGVMHVVAASGFNVALVAMAALQLFLLLLSRRWAIVAAMFAIAGYVLLAGAGPAVVRAGLMGGLAFVAQGLGREYMASRGLWLGAGVMLLLQPWLMRDVSFLLSVSATLGLIFLAPLLVKMLEKARLGLGLRGMHGDKKDNKPEMGATYTLHMNVMTTGASTLAATIMTLPVILIYFESLSVVSLVVNVLVLELVPPLMILGGLGALVGLIVPTVGQWLILLSWPLLALFVAVVEIFGRWSLAQLEFGGLGWWFGAGWWLVVGGGVILIRKKLGGITEGGK